MRTTDRTRSAFSRRKTAKESASRETRVLGQGTPVTSKALITLVLAVDVAALAALFVLPTTGFEERLGVLLLLAGLAALVGSRPVRISPLKLEMIPTHPFILVALAALGPMAAVLVSVAGVVAAAIGGGRRPKAIRLAFNLGAVILSTAGASWAFFGVGGGFSQALGALMLPLATATAAFFVINSGLVTAAITIEKSQAYFATWKRTFSWSPWSYLMGLTVAVAMLAALDVALIWALVLAVAPCWLLVCFYRSEAGSRGRLANNP